MPEILHVQEGTEIIHITSYGEVTGHDLQKTRDSLFRTVCEKGLTKVLVDATGITGKLRTLEAYKHGSHLGVNQILRRAKYAIVFSERSRDDIVFMGTVAHNRGARVKLFESKDEAIDWLQNG